jgi:hypothetical protein
MIKTKTDLIYAVADKIRTDYGYLSYEPSTLEKFITNCPLDATVDTIADYFQDYCLAQGLCDVQE